MREIDHIAFMAMMGILSRGGQGIGATAVATTSYFYADAMVKEMKAREKKERNIEAQLREGGKDR